jgi:hypothetical protein
MHDALHTALHELQVVSSGDFRKVGSGRLFAEVITVVRIKRHGKPDFVRGTARCHQLRLNVYFDTYSVSTGPLYVGPAIIPGTAATDIVGKRNKQKRPATVLFGNVTLAQKGYRFVRCVAAEHLFFFYQNACKPIAYLLDNADALEIPDNDPSSKASMDLVALSGLLHRSFDTLLEPLRKVGTGPVPLLSWRPQDFVILTCLLVRDASLYGQFIEIVKRRRKELVHDRVEKILNGAVPVQALSDFIEKQTVEKLQACSTVKFKSKNQFRSKNQFKSKNQFRSKNQFKSEQPPMAESSDSELSC